jgi:dethiobiotin synthetase/adenosylmethionine--8-amino-7-oxononanoate aminotransferase
MSRVPSGLWRKHVAVQIYGANTDVGKTVFSTLLGKRFMKHKNWRVHFIKPVSTGPQSDRDDESVNPSPVFHEH